MKKAKPSHQPSRRQLIWLIIVFLLIVGAACWLAINQIMIARDRTRFEAVSKDKSLIASRLVATLGDNVISTREQDECFNAEQGPWDNGNLWCQVATVIMLKQNVSFDRIGEQYLAIAESAGEATQSSGISTTARFWYSNEGMTCSLSSIDSMGHELGSATSDPFTVRNKPALAVTCADRAREAFYTYDQ